MKARLATLACALLLPVAAAAQSTTQFSLSLGYQTFDVDGNEDVYRSHTGQDEGFVLRSFSLTSTTPGGVFDRVRVEGGGFGASPDARLRVEADNHGAYRLLLSARRHEVYSALPELGNPFAELGVIAGARTFDRERTSIDLDLELLPGRAVSPVIGYSRHTYDGPGRTVLTVGGDEFVMRDEVDETVDELRVGANVRLAGFTATVLQGWRSIDIEDRFTLAGPSGGFSPNPLLGRDVTLADFDRTSRVDGDSPVTTALLSGQLGSRVRVVATFARSEQDLEIDERETSSGSLVSFAISRFFSGLDETASNRADGPTWRGDARIEAELAPWLDLVASHGRSERSSSGRTLLTSLFTGTTTFTGGDARDITETLATRNAYEREEAVSEARLVARPASFLRLWASYAQVAQETTVEADVAEIVVPGGQGGEFERDIDRLAAGANLTAGPVMLTVDWLDDDADEAILRTDVLTRERLRARVSVSPIEQLRLAGTFSDTEFDNPTAGIEFDGSSRTWGAEAEIVPVKALSLLLAYGKTEADTSILIRRPEDFTVEPSLFAEDGESKDASLRLNLGRFRLSGGVSRFENEGSFPLRLDRSFAELHVDIAGGFGVTALGETRDYEQDLLAAGDYEADRYGFFLTFASK